MTEKTVRRKKPPQKKRNPFHNTLFEKRPVVPFMNNPLYLAPPETIVRYLLSQEKEKREATNLYLKTNLPSEKKQEVVMNIIKLVSHHICHKDIGVRTSVKEILLETLQAVPELERLGREAPEEEKRLMAIELLKEYKEEGANALLMLLKRYRGNSSEREAIIKSLKLIGKPAVAICMSAFSYDIHIVPKVLLIRDNDPSKLVRHSVVKAAMEALHTIAERDSAVGLKKIISNKDEMYEIRFLALKTLNRIKDSSDIDDLISFLKITKAREMKLFVMNMLIELNADKPVDEIKKMVESSDETEKIAAK
ncbi:HEAT repeat domain-containing protein [Candidatus Micrarchaeota archaeon]|nr:HEAT repeat domain-containing protein [Candidatus Micrarchaeota archaeon]